MANQLGVARIHSILTLHEQGHSHRQIAGLLGVHRETVSRHLRLARGRDDPDSKPATPGSAPPAPEPEAPTGSADSKPATVEQAPTGSDGSKPATPGNAPTGSTTPPKSASIAGEASPGSVRTSQCEPWREQILAKLE